MGRIPYFPPWQDHWQTIGWKKWLGVIIGGIYQAAHEEITWAYEPVYDLWPDIDPDSDSSNYGLSDEGSKDQYKPDYQ